MDESKRPTRRQLGAVMVAATSGLAAPASAAPGLTPAMTHVFDLDIEVAPAQELGEVGGGRRRVIPITGGGLNGPGIKGVVLPGGADWQTIRPDGVTLLQARYTIRLDDGQTVGVINTGVRRASPDIVRRLTAGEVVDPALYYFRATPVFEVGPGPHGWLTESVFLSLGERLPDRVRLKVFRVD
jgi:hypothetical protein